eukprot:15437247-Alexandrium_andersonii.AAC.1
MPHSNTDNGGGRGETSAALPALQTRECRDANTRTHAHAQSRRRGDDWTRAEDARQKHARREAASGQPRAI